MSKFSPRAVLEAVGRRARPAARAAAARWDRFSQRAWEQAAFHLHRLPSGGEMSAVVQRMGLAGFSEYAAGQMLGAFGPRTFVGLERKAEIVTRLQNEFPEEAKRIIAAADRVLAGKFDLLGSGEKDARRGKSGSGHRIDWQLDLGSGLRFPRVFHFLRWKLDEMKPGNADVKGPWEIGRLQHLPTVGQAYWLTGDAKYPQYFARVVDDFIRRNPVGFGVQWACAMDVALRAVSLTLGVDFFQGAKELSYGWWRRFLKSMLEHGRFLAGNLEYGSAVGRMFGSNHNLSNLLGIHFLAHAFPHLDPGWAWRGMADNLLEREIVHQILPDGGDFESSVPYQRLVVEILLSAYALSKHRQLPQSAEYRERLLASLRFIRALRQDGGRMPQIGDADDGRAHILSGYGTAWHESMDSLLVAGAHVLNCPELAEGAGDEAKVEALFWGPPSTEPAVATTPKASLTVLPDSQITVLRQAESYLLFANGVVGTHGVGNHKHNDQLAIEWAVGRQPLFVDGGSYAYTCDAAARNQFRSTHTHNTVSVAGEEQHRTDPKLLFRLFQAGAAELVGTKSADDTVGVAAMHRGYERLDPPLTHTRRVLMQPDGIAIIDDRFESDGRHPLRWFFLLYPGLTVKLDAGRLQLHGEHGGGTMLFDEDTTAKLVDAWYSPGYGKRVRTQALVIEREHDGRPAHFALVPHGVTEPFFVDAADGSEQFWNADVRAPQTLAA